MTIIKPMPLWAGSMVQNYRDQFKRKYGRDTTLSNASILEITETIFDDSDNEVQDAVRVEAMKDQEQ